MGGERERERESKKDIFLLVGARSVYLHKNFLSLSHCFTETCFGQLGTENENNVLVGKKLFESFLFFIKLTKGCSFRKLSIRNSAIFTF